MTPAQIKLARAFARKFGSFSDLDEAYSIALLAVWRASRTWKADGGMTFASWAKWYCQRALGDQRRRQARWWGLTAGVDPEWLGSGGDEPDDRAAALRRAVAKLPPTQREAVELVWLQGMSQVDAAAHFGTTRQAVANRIEAALKKLKRALQDAGVTPF